MESLRKYQLGICTVTVILFSSVSHGDDAKLLAEVRRQVTPVYEQAKYCRCSSAYQGFKVDEDALISN